MRRRRPSAAGAVGDRIGGRASSAAGGWLASFGLGAIFAIGWTPCIGIILGGILTLADHVGHAASGRVLLIAYTIGLGLPFIAHRRRCTTARRRSCGRSSATAARSRSSAGCSWCSSASR